MPSRKPHKSGATEGPIAKDLRQKIDWLFHHGGLTPEQHEELSNKQLLQPLAKVLNTGVSYATPRGNMLMQPLTMRELRGREFQFVLIIPAEETGKSSRGKQGRRRKKRKCFVGHRFIDVVTDNFRHNLASVFHYFGIAPDYSDTGVINGQILDTIVAKIKTSDFCIFDNRLTESKPNVYIEIGVAIALKKPYYFFEFKDTKEGVPSDLSGLLALRYRDYRELVTEFSLTLPGFLKAHGLT